MKFRKSRPPAAERVHIQRVSLLQRGVSWIILKSLGLVLMVVFAGIGFSAWKFLADDHSPPAAPDPFSPAAVAASSVAPIDYSRHPPPAGMTDAPPLPHSVRSAAAPFVEPPLPGSPPMPISAPPSTRPSPSAHHVTRH
jgi:cytoskeletal protein RodZ